MRWLPDRLERRARALEAGRAGRHPDELRRPRQGRRRTRGGDRRRRDDQRRKRRRGRGARSSPARSLAPGPKLAVRVNPPFAIEDGRGDDGRAGSPFGVDAERAAALVQGIVAAGVDWRGLHIYAAAQASIGGRSDRNPQSDRRCAGEMPTRSACRCPSSTSAAASVSPYFDGEEPLNVDRLADGLAEALRRVPNCSRKRGSRSSSALARLPKPGSI